MESSSFAHRLAISGALPRLQVGMDSTVNIGFLAPLSGPVEILGAAGSAWLPHLGGLAEQCGRGADRRAALSDPHSCP